MEVTPDSQPDTTNNPTVQAPFKPRRKIPFIPILGVSITAIVAIGIVVGLMWQSNSFIAQNQDVRSDASSAEDVSQSNHVRVTDLLQLQFNNYKNWSRTSSAVSGLSGNDLRAAWNNAYSFYLLGIATNNEVARANGMVLINGLIDNLDLNQPSRDFGWPLHLEAMSRTYAIAKDELSSARSTKLTNKINQFAREMMREKKVFKFTSSGGYAFINGELKKKKGNNWNSAFFKPDDVPVVSVDVYHDGISDRVVSLVVSNIEKPWINSRDQNAIAVTFVLSSKAEESIARFDRLGTRKDERIAATLHTGWNTIDIRSWDGKEVHFWHDGGSVAKSIEYVDGLNRVTFGVVGDSKDTYIGKFKLDGVEYDKYDDFGASKPWNYVLSSNQNSISLDTSITPWNSVWGGYVGNTAAESNAWTASGLSWYSLHVPGATDYLEKAKCFAYHSITTSRDQEYCGIKTQTVHDSFKLDNHYFVNGHPGYAAATLVSLASGQQAYQLANKPVPSEFSHNTENLYQWMLSRLEKPNDISHSTKFLGTKDWGWGADTLMRAAFYLDQAGKDVQLQQLLSRYKTEFPNIVSHPVNVDRATMLNGVMSGEVLAPILINNLRCSGPQITSITNACSGSGYTTTVRWNTVPGATEYYVAYDDDTNFWQNVNQETGEPVQVKLSAANSWTSSAFTTKKDRYYQVRVAKATSCIPHVAAWGNSQTSSAACTQPVNSPTAIPPTSTPKINCSRVEISSISPSCSATGAMAVTLQWPHQTGASDYAIAIDDDPNFWTDSSAGNEQGAAPYAVSTAGGSNATRTWSGTFPSGSTRYFRIRTRQSTACTPQDWLYGAAKNATITCTTSQPPTASFTEYPGVEVSQGNTARMKVNCADVNSDLTSCYMLRRERPVGGSWSGWSAKIKEKTSTAGTNSLTSDLQEWTCYSNQIGMGHEWVVEGIDKSGKKCTGKETKPNGWVDCGGSDRVVFTCTPPADTSNPGESSDLVSNRRITIRAKGVKSGNVWPKLELHIKNASGTYQLAKTFTINAQDYRGFSYLHSSPFNASQVRLKFVNDAGARDLYVDYIKFGKAIYQTEAATTYSTGTWVSSTRACTPGYHSSQTLHCNGYFDFFK